MKNLTLIQLEDSIKLLTMILFVRCNLWNVWCLFSFADYVLIVHQSKINTDFLNLGLCTTHATQIASTIHHFASTINVKLLIYLYWICIHNSESFMILEYRYLTSLKLFSSWKILIHFWNLIKIFLDRQKKL